MADGISLLDLLVLPPGVRALIPNSVTTFLDPLAAQDLHAAVQGDQIVHEGRLQSLQDSVPGLLLGGTADWFVRMPQLTGDDPDTLPGVPFRLTIPRVVGAPVPPAVEPAAFGFVLDLFFDRLEIQLPPYMEPAELIEDVGVARHLVKDTSHDDVRLILSDQVLRVQVDASGTDVSLVAPPDPFDLDAPAGTVIRTSLQPPHVRFGGGLWGMTAGAMILDVSGQVTPPEIQARRAVNADWTGLALEELTFYLPQGLPAIGDVSIGISQFLYGFDDHGVQLELEVQAGVAPGSPQDITWFQRDQANQLGLDDPGGAGRTRTVLLDPATRWPTQVMAQTTGKARFVLPNRTAIDGESSGWFTVSGAADTLTFERLADRPDELVDEDGDGEDDRDPLEGDTWTFTFDIGGGNRREPPTIQVSTWGGDYDDVSHMAGPASILGESAFIARPPHGAANFTPADVEGLTWILDDGVATTVRGKMGLGPLFRSGVRSITLRDRFGATRRLLMDPEPEGNDLRIGHRSQAGPPYVAQVTTLAAPTAAQPTVVRRSAPLADLQALDLKAWHSGSTQRSVRYKSSIDPADTTRARMAPGQVAEVRVATGEELVEEARQLRVLFEYDAPSPSAGKGSLVRGTRCVYPVVPGDVPEAGTQAHQGSPVEIGYGPHDHVQANLQDQGQAGRITHTFHRGAPQQHTREWVQGLPPDTHYVIVGRTCDLAVGDDAARKTYNKWLGVRRALDGASLLISQGVDPGRISVRGEQIPGWLDAGVLNNLATGLSGKEKAWAKEASGLAPAGLSLNPPTQGVLDDRVDAFTTVEWLVETTSIRTDLGPDRQGPGRHHPYRQEHRRAEIIALYGARPDGFRLPRAPDSVKPDLTGCKRVTHPTSTLIVPGPWPVELPSRPADPDVPWRAVLRLVWDSPTNDEGAWVPTLAEARVDLPVDLFLGKPIPGQPDDQALEFWSFLGGWSWDRSTGQTRAWLAWDGGSAQDGLYPFDDKWVAVAMAFGPSLIAGLSDGQRRGERAADVVTLGATAGFLGAFSTFGRTTIRRIELEHVAVEPLTWDHSVTRLGVDYDVSLWFGGAPEGETAEDAPALPLGLRTREPLRIRLKDVGLVWDDATGTFSLDFQVSELALVDTGAWEIEGGIGELLGVKAVRTGLGSLWVEIDLELGADLGVVEVTGATVRLTFGVDENGDPDVGFELRGLQASVDVPGVIEGRGQLQLGQGSVQASIDATLIPLEVRVDASLGLVQRPGYTMVDVGVGVRFAAGIPLLSTGAAIYGFSGRFVSHGKRMINGTGPLAEFGWAAGRQYEPEKGSFGLGLGVVLGTLPDGGFTFNAQSVLALQVPDVTVSLVVEGSFLKSPTDGFEAPAGPDDSSGPGIEARILGIITASSRGVAVAVQGSVGIKRLIQLEVPVAAWFPVQDPATSYLRIGSDGHKGRDGSPVSLTVLPGLLDVEASCYLMVEGSGIEELGGPGGPTFRGFAVGFGADWGQEYGAGPFKVSFGAWVRAGLAVRPFFVAAEVGLRGSLDLVILSVSVSARLGMGLGTTQWYLEGEICGRVKLFFFTIKGCVGFRLSNKGEADDPIEAGPLVEDLVLADRRGRLVDQDVGGEPIGWPDAVPVLRFSHPMWIHPSLGGPFDVIAPVIPSAWVGSSDLRFAYRLDSIEIERNEDGTWTPVRDLDHLPATWWHPLDVGPPEDGMPPVLDQDRVAQLALGHLDAQPLARNLPRRGEDLPGSPARWAQSLCEPPPEPARACAFGEDLHLVDDAMGQLTSRPVPDVAYPSHFTVALNPSDVDSQVISLIVAGTGWSYFGMRLVTLDPPVTPEHGAPVDRALALPAVGLSGIPLQSLPLMARYAPQVLDPDLTLRLVLDLPDPIRPSLDQCVELDQVEGSGSVPSVEATPFTVHGPELRWVQTPQGRALEADRELHVLIDGPNDETRLSVQATGTQVVHVRALFAGGAVSHEQDVTLTAGWTTVRIPTSGTAHVVLSAGGTVRLRGMCVVRPDPLQGLEKQVMAGLGPRLEHLLPNLVRGQTDDGAWHGWSGVPRGIDVDLPRMRIVIVSHHRAPLGRTWQAFQLIPQAMPGFTFELICTCALSEDAVLAARNEQARRDAEREREDRAAQEPSSDGLPGESDRRQAVWRPDARYRVRTSWSVVRWQRPDGAGDASPPAVPDWSTAQTESKNFPFRTAPLRPDVLDRFEAERNDQRPLPELGEVDLAAANPFDPRALAAYVQGFRPGDAAVAVFRDDDLAVFFSQGHLPRVLNRYGLVPSIRVRRTDPPGGSMVQREHPLDLMLQIDWSALPFLLQDPMDQQRVLALVDEACFEPAVPGATAWVRAPLEPRADYDLILSAIPDMDNEVEGISIARCHFHTSAHLGPEGLLRALGLGLDGQVGDVPPLDLRIETTMANDIALDDDDGLDQALAELGLDPLPLPRTPRVLVLWRREGDGSWRLDGVLVDSDEPIQRPAPPGATAPRLRCHGGAVEVDEQPFGELLLVRSNAAGTRLLLRFLSDRALPAESPVSLRLDVADGETGALLQARIRLLPTPVMVDQEVTS